MPIYTKNIYEIKDYWHIAHGYLHDYEGNKKILSKVHIRYFKDKDMSDKVHIVTYSDILKLPTYNIFAIEIFNKMHENIKEVFGQIINNDILKSFVR